MGVKSILSSKIKFLPFQFGLFLLITLIACKPIEEKEYANPVKPVFNPTVANSELEGKTPEQKWDYLLKTFDYKHPKSAEFEEWFLEKFNDVKEEDFTPSEAIVKAIHEQFSGFKYFIAGKAFAEYTLFSEYPTPFQSSKNLAYDLMAQYFLFDKQLDSTAKYLAKLEKGLGSESSKHLNISYFNTKAELESLKGNMFEAVVNFNRALDNVPKTDVINQFMLNLSIAGMYSDYDFIDKAKYHVDVAYKLLPFDSIPEKYLNTLGVVEYKAGNFILADKIFERAVQFANKQGRPEIIAPTYTNYANLRLREKKYDEAMDFLSKSDSISGVNGMQVGFLINRLNRTEIYYYQGLYDEALNELQLAYPDLIAYDVLNFNIAYHESLFKIYDKLGIQALADRNHRKFTEYQNEYQGNISISAISEWELAAERERAIVETNAVNSALEREVRNKYLIALVLTILLLFLSFSYFFIFRKRLLEREKFQMVRVRLQKALEEKSKTLLTESLNNLTIQNTKEEILLEIDEILARLPDKTKKEFSALTYKLRFGKDSNFLYEFESRFLGVYETFYEKLLEQAPDLTPNELRVCAFMRLNITSKDIARLTGKRGGTIDNNKTVIRKKLNLSSDDNLQKYLLNL